MLPKEYRLRQEKDIKALFANSKSVFDVCIGLRYRKNTLNLSRFAVVVGTKVSKKAVDRNKIRRRIRSVLQKRLIEIRPGFDVVFLVKKEVLSASFKEVEEQVERLLQKANLLV